MLLVVTCIPRTALLVTEKLVLPFVKQLLFISL